MREHRALAEARAAAVRAHRRDQERFGAGLAQRAHTARRIAVDARDAATAGRDRNPGTRTKSGALQNRSERAPYGRTDVVDVVDAQGVTDEPAFDRHGAVSVSAMTSRSVWARCDASPSRAAAAS